MSLYRELKRRNVFRVGIAYAITAWLIAQIAGLAATSFLAPVWVMKMIITMLLLGFPLAMFFAWAYELTPEGLRRESEIEQGQSTAQETAGKLDRTIIIALVAALAYFAYDKFVLDPRRDTALLESAALHQTQASIEAEQAEKSTAAAERSIAVLPFVNMSDDPGNEYFSEGLSEELLNLLVKIPELRVAARTSSFSFRENPDIQISEIARQLHVAYILEGSVRKSGNKVRITAQLIKADEGFHLWSETFDRDLDDIFVVQDEIASRVAQALKVTLLGTSQAERMIDPEAYVLYLKGQHLLTLGPQGSLTRSEEFLLQALELDPGFAEAWVSLAMNYYYQIQTSIKSREDGVALAKDAVERAKGIDPGRGLAWGVDSYLKNHLDWDWTAAQAAIIKAYELEPNNDWIRRWRASTAHSLGKLDEAIELYEQVILNDPINLGGYSALGNVYMKAHHYEKATEVFEKQAEISPAHYWTYFNLGKTFLFRGDAEQALLEIKKNPDNEFRIVGLVMAYSNLGREAEAATELQRLVLDYGEKNPVWVAEAYSWRGDIDKAFEWLERAYVQRNSSLSYLLGNNVFYPLKDDPRWVELLGKMNLLEYWLEMPAEYGGPAGSPD